MATIANPNAAGPSKVALLETASHGAQHPSMLWETAFIYAFITRFTPLRGKVDGLDSPSDFEDALICAGPHPVIEAILIKFISNLRPNTAVKSANISTIVGNIIHDLCRTSEQSVWWRSKLKKNEPPILGEAGFFGLSWQIKIQVLRQLVQWQLTHSTSIREILDVAWGVRASKHKKHKEGTVYAPPPPEDPHSMESLSVHPLGQTSDRVRYWALDDSPRMYKSSNPWKVDCPMTAVCSTRDEFEAVLSRLKAEALPLPTRPKKPKAFEAKHIELVKKLEEEQLPKVDADLVRLAKARKRIEQQKMLAEQAVLRTTRTRRQTRRPDYVYDFMDEDGNDAGDDEDYIDQGDDDDASLDGLSNNGGLRRSSRAGVQNARKRTSEVFEDGFEWRGERRSTRLSTTVAQDLDRPAKRSRHSSAASSTPAADVSSLSLVNGTSSLAAVEKAEDIVDINGIKAKKSGASGIKPTETALPTVAGKKKSKFWYYAVEPIPAPLANGLPAVPTPNLLNSIPDATPSAAPSISAASCSSTKHELSVTSPQTVAGSNGVSKPSSVNGKSSDAGGPQQSPPVVAVLPTMEVDAVQAGSGSEMAFSD